MLFVNERKGGLGMKVSIELSPEYRFRMQSFMRIK